MRQNNPISSVDPGLIEFATQRDLDYIEALGEHGSARKAAKALGINKSTITEALGRLKQRAAVRGFSPEHGWNKSVPSTHIAKGVSTYYDDEGKVRGQWVKADIDRTKMLQAVKDAVQDLVADVPRAPPAQSPKASNADLATLYTLTDSHVGMLAWHKEAGEDWDLKIAEDVLTGCFQHMVDAAPPSEIGIVNQLGDFLHADGIQPVTPTSGHLLDTDGRFEKVSRVAVRILRRVIDMALSKHTRVILLLAEGNHDITSSIWLRLLFQTLYENEPRVSVIDSALPYYAIHHGKTMLAFHHGHLKKNDQLPLLMAAQFPTIWGGTTKRYCHTGHRHHVEIKEHSGMTVQQHATLAARDAYAARGGWIAERQVQAITYHREWGQVSQLTVVPEMLAR